MTRQAPKIAAFAVSSVVLGAMLALATPTDLRTNRNSAIDQLGEPKIVEYPGAQNAVASLPSPATKPRSSTATVYPRPSAMLEAVAW